MAMTGIGIESFDDYGLRSEIDDDLWRRAERLADLGVGNFGDEALHLQQMQDDAAARAAKRNQQVYEVDYTTGLLTPSAVKHHAVQAYDSDPPEYDEQGHPVYNPQGESHKTAKQIQQCHDGAEVPKQMLRSLGLYKDTRHPLPLYLTDPSPTLPGVA